MSSILEALKKLETSKDDPVAEFTWPQSVNAKETLHSRLRGRSVFKHPVLIFFLAALTVMCFYLLYNKKERVRVSTAPALPEGKRSIPVEKEMAGQVKIVETEKAVEPLDVVGPELPEVSPQPEVSSQIEMEPPLVKDLTEVAAINEEKIKPADLETLPPGGAVTETDAIAELDEEAQAYYNSIPEEMRPPQKMVDDKWLKLHAISWSEDPGRRIAVINSVIVKEGRVVEGGLVSRIDKDYVVIVKGGEEFMLPFGLR